MIKASPLCSMADVNGTVMFGPQVTETATVSFTDQLAAEQAGDKGVANKLFESDSLQEVSGSLDDDGAELAITSGESSKESSGGEKKKKKGRRRKEAG